MDLATVRLLEVEIESFRGFAKAQVVPLDGDVVLVSGGNGTGKTSLTDALTWNLTGELPALASRLKGERKGEDYVLSCYGSGPARVRLTVLVNGQRWDIERRGSASGSELRISPTDVPAADARNELARLFGFERHALMATAVHAWGVLRQDAMRATLDQGSEALHRRLREILGLGALAEFETATRETSQALVGEAAEARKELDQLAADLRTARTELGAAEQRESRRATAQAAAADALERLRSTPVGQVQIFLEPGAQSGEVADVGSQVTTLLRVAADLTQEIAGAPSADAAPAPQTIAELRLRREEAEGTLAALEAQRDAEKRMVEAALTLLSDCCPVCDQRIEQEEVREALLARMAEDAAGAAAVAQARERAQRARAALDQAEVSARRAQTAKLIRERARSRWREALALATRVRVPAGWSELEALEDAQSGLRTARDELRVVYRTLIEVEHDPAVAGLAARVARLQSDESQARERAEVAARRAQQAEVLRKAATESAVEITQESLQALEPAFAEVYDRLAPHPSFTHLTMFHDVYYGKGRSSPRILDPVRGVEANPNLVCSEGQLNVVALSYFLALNLETQQGGLPFAVLDDPLQAMDVINVLGFCDVARALRQHRQLIITTHDRRFGGLLERKLSPREMGQRTLHLEFSAWDPTGPSVDVVQPEMEQVPLLLQAA